MPSRAAAQVDGQPELGAPRTESDGVFERRAPSETRRRAAPKRTKSTGDSPRGSPSMAYRAEANQALLKGAHPGGPVGFSIPPVPAPAQGTCRLLRARERASCSTSRAGSRCTPQSTPTCGAPRPGSKITTTSSAAAATSASKDTTRTRQRSNGGLQSVIPSSLGAADVAEQHRGGREDREGPVEEEREVAERAVRRPGPRRPANGGIN